MFLLFEIGSPFEAMFVSIPESVGVLFFGIGLAVVAVGIRALIARTEKRETDREGTIGR